MDTRIDDQDQLGQAVVRGIDFLAAMQQPSGTFNIYCWPHPFLEEKNYKPDYSTFQTAQIAYCVDFARSEKAQAIIDHAIGFLVANMQDGCVWRYACPPQPGLSRSRCRRHVHHIGASPAPRSTGSRQH